MPFKLSVLCLAIFYFSTAQSKSKDHITFVISIDSFRYEYITEEHTPTLYRLMKDGCTTESMENVFPTLTYPNHMSLATGVYPEVHGVIGNHFFDSKMRRRIRYGYEMFHYNKDVRPIWTENELRGGHSAVIGWPGCEFEYEGVKPTWMTPNFLLPWKRRVKMALSYLQDKEKPANLVMMYTQLVDYVTHSFGPSDDVSLESVRATDKGLQYLLDRLEDADLMNQTNLFLVSDHGMEAVTLADMIDLRPIVNENFYDVVADSPIRYVHPKAGKMDEVYGKLKNASLEMSGFDVYRKEDLPERWHLKCDRTSPIVLVAKAPYNFQDFFKYALAYSLLSNSLLDMDNQKYGEHGYDSRDTPSMKQFFIAIGPDIRERTRVPEFSVVDLFAVWATLLSFPDAIERTNSSTEPIPHILKIKPMNGLLSGLICLRTTRSCQQLRSRNLPERKG